MEQADSAMSYKLLQFSALAALAFGASGCMTTPNNPIPAHPSVDLERFMGDWYVIANIPTRLERTAHNAIESYRLDPDGTIATTFVFRDGAFDGPEKRYEPRGFVREGAGNAIWGMRFFWYFPLKWEYVVSYVNEDYTQTIIGRSARDYVWIMARTPQLSTADYDRLVERVRALGYDTSRLNRVPQQWAAPAN
jgi:apolipoprotein D and lipocalin family protein